jgi:enolase-phosphatase E1
VSSSGAGAPIRAIVTDIEGTTSTIAFVKDVLFPYADAHLDAYVALHRTDAVVAAALREAAELAGEPDAADARVLAHLHDWIAADRKATPLKTLQGLIWAAGYERGELHGHVYDDVPPALRAWHAAGIALYVYSSGSIVAQKVLFAHTAFGDLTPLFRDHFDTTIGAKRDAASYAAIARATGCAPEAMLFLSDVDAELDAARATGMQTGRLLRPSDTPPGATTTHPAYADFRAIRPVRPSRRDAASA